MHLRQSCRPLIAAIALALPGVAVSAECDADLATADTAIAAGPRENVTAADFQQAVELRAEAGRRLASGDDAACMEAIGEALALLGISIQE